MPEVTSNSAGETTPGVLDMLRALNSGARSQASELSEPDQRQVQILSWLLAVPAPQVPTRLRELIPNLRLTYSSEIQWSGTSFRRDDIWRIHIRASDDPTRQTETLLRELKIIIDRPAHVDDQRSSARLHIATGFALEVMRTLPAGTERA